MTNRCSRASLVCLTLIAMGSLAHAQTYPAKAVRLIVPFPPGGGTDYTARLFGNELSTLWGQPVVIENRPGASTTMLSTRFRSSRTLPGHG